MAQCEAYRLSGQRCPKDAVDGIYCKEHKPPKPYNLRDLLGRGYKAAEVINAGVAVYEAIKFIVEHVLPHLGTATRERQIAVATELQDVAAAIRRRAEALAPDDDSSEQLMPLTQELEDLVDRVEDWKVAVEFKNEVELAFEGED